MTIKNVYLPKLSEMGRRFFHNTASGNYQVNLVNISINGNLVGSIDTAIDSSVNAYRGYVYKETTGNWGWIAYSQGHDFSYTTTSDFNPNIQKHVETVNYKNDLNVFIWGYQIYLQNSVKEFYNDIYLPYRELKRHLNVGASSNTLLVDGLEYISCTQLLTSSMAGSVSITDNNLLINPINIGADILVEEGEISKFAEYGAQYQYFSISNDGENTLYTVTDCTEGGREGI